MSLYKVILYNPLNFEEMIWESQYMTSLKCIYDQFKQKFPSSLITYSILKNVNLKRNVRDAQYIKIEVKRLEFSEKRVIELQRLCKKYSVKSCGKKIDLCVRLQDVQCYKDTTDNQLRNMCRDNLLSVNGKRELLINRLIKNKKIKINNETHLKELIKNKVIVMVYAKWCSTCKRQLSLFKKQNKNNYYVMNIDDMISHEYVGEHEEAPLYCLFENGKLIKKGRNLIDIS